jgi:PAS domain S-box-containing protein
MSDEQFKHHIETLRQQLEAFHAGLSAQEEIAMVLEALELIEEERQTSFEAAEIVGAELLQQNQQISTDCRRYYDLFHSAPIAYLVTDHNGLILQANQAIASLLNTSPHFLTQKPLAAFVAQADRRAFRTALLQLAQAVGVQTWQMTLCPKNGTPFAAELQVAIVRDLQGEVKLLRIGVHDVSRYQQAVAQPTVQLEQEIPTATPASPLPHSLDGLQVLIVDDEADAREFVTAVLESHGIRVRAVATAAAALAALDQFHPDVLVSDIRMPNEDGYSLIRKVREQSAQRGWHVSAAAITAYLDEDREKVLAAGFEAHLHKLAQPTELVEMVAQLAGRTLQ